MDTNWLRNELVRIVKRAKKGARDITREKDGTTPFVAHQERAKSNLLLNRSTIEHLKEREP